jgi:prolyl 4-hydroxylase
LVLQQRLAARGFQRAAWETGYLADQAESGAEAGVAASAFARACALGYPPAYYSLGLRFATGAGIARDAAFARALLLRAADAGFPDARAAADEFVPEAEAGTTAADWHARLKANLDAAEDLLAALVPGIESADGSLDPLVAKLETHFASVGHPALRIADGRLQVAASAAPAEATARDWNWLAQRPRVATCADFATREECAHLMHKVGDSLARARDFVRGGENDDSEITNFNGSGRPLGPMHADAVVRMLEARIAGMTGWRIDALEPCSIIRYQPGE